MLGTRFADGLQATLLSAMGSGTDPREMLVKTIDAYLSFVERDPEVYRFLVRHLTASPENGSDELSVGNFLRQVGNQVAVVVGEQMRAARVDSGGAEPLAHGGQVQREAHRAETRADGQLRRHCGWRGIEHGRLGRQHPLAVDVQETGPAGARLNGGRAEVHRQPLQRGVRRHLDRP